MLIGTDELKRALLLCGVPADLLDDTEMEYVSECAEQEAKNWCNADTLPVEAAFAVRNLAVSLYFFNAGAAVTAAWAKEMGEPAGARVKTVQEGDTSVTYMTDSEGGRDAAGRVSGLEASFQKKAYAQLAPFRCLSW